MARGIPEEIKRGRDEPSRAMGNILRPLQRMQIPSRPRALVAQVDVLAGRRLASYINCAAAIIFWLPPPPPPGSTRPPRELRAASSLSSETQN